MTRYIPHLILQEAKEYCHFQYRFLKLLHGKVKSHLFTQYGHSSTQNFHDKNKKDRGWVISLFLKNITFLPGSKGCDVNVF